MPWVAMAQTPNDEPKSTCRWLASSPAAGIQPSALFRRPLAGGAMGKVLEAVKAALVKRPPSLAPRATSHTGSEKQVLREY